MNDEKRKLLIHHYARLLTSKAFQELKSSSEEEIRVLLRDTGHLLMENWHTWKHLTPQEQLYVKDFF